MNVWSSRRGADAPASTPRRPRRARPTPCNLRPIPCSYALGPPTRARSPGAHALAPTPWNPSPGVQRSPTQRNARPLGNAWGPRLGTQSPRARGPHNRLCPHRAGPLLRGADPGPTAPSPERVEHAPESRLGMRTAQPAPNRGRLAPTDTAPASPRTRSAGNSHLRKIRAQPCGQKPPTLCRSPRTQNLPAGYRA